MPPLDDLTTLLSAGIAQFHPFSDGLVAPFDERSTGEVGDIEALARTLKDHCVEDVSTGLRFGLYRD